MTHSFSANALRVFKGERCLFAGLEFAIESGQLLALRGANGSGKTSLLRALAGLAEFDEGTVHWDGQAVHPRNQEFRTQLTWYGHQAGFKGDLTAAENLEFESVLRRQSRRSVSDVLASLGLKRQAALPTRALSAGQQRRAALARLVLSETPLWVMDEPFTNLDVDGKKQINAMLDEHLSNGGLAVVASHETLALSAPVVELTIE